MALFGAFELEKLVFWVLFALRYALISRTCGATVGLFKSGCLYRSRFRHGSLWVCRFIF